MAYACNFILPFPFDELYDSRGRYHEVHASNVPEELGGRGGGRFLVKPSASSLKRELSLRSKLPGWLAGYAPQVPKRVQYNMKRLHPGSNTDVRNN